MKKNFLKELLVWIIVASAIIIFSVFIYIIGVNKGQLFGSFIMYKTQMREVSGVYIGSKVTIHGNITGNIIDIKLLSNGKVEISFSVKKKHEFVITESSFVELKKSGLLGDRYVNIITNNLSAPKLKKGSLIPYKKTSNLLSFFMEDTKKLNPSFHDVLKDIQKLVNRFNEKDLIKEFLSKADQKKLSEILQHTKNILEKIESGSGSLGALINDRSVYNKLLVILGERPKQNYLQDLIIDQSQKSQTQKK